jgi:hypothetical protein
MGSSRLVLSRLHGHLAQKARSANYLRRFASVNAWLRRAGKLQ